ncbi:Uncharacterized protein Adt_11157 [Abeliophyllum distichum]|uniref:CCHC-type domain-containing protein n=1 Tax=Abeliophyllum distichum TaxID=126358 RepID=A0ABD1UN13_9LAMI
MKGILIQQKVSKASDNSYGPNVNEDQKKDFDELAYTSIILHLSDPVLHKVEKFDSTEKLLKKLEELYLIQSTPNKIYLLENFFSFKIDPSMDLDDNLDIFNKLVQDITNCGEMVPEINKAIILLNIIFDSFKEVKNAIKYGRETLTPDIVIDSLKSKERELRFEKNERKNGEIYFVRGRRQSGDGSGGGGEQNSGSNRKSRSRYKSHGRVKGKKCYGCRKIGHFISECYKEKNKQREEDQRETNVVTSSDESSEVYMLLKFELAEINLSINSHIHEWILDSGSSFHVTSNKFWFDHLHESDHEHVVAEGRVTYRIIGVGNVIVKFDSGFVHTLKEVRYVPYMGRNLISIGELESTSFMGRLGNGMIRMCKGALRAFKATRRKGIYFTHAKVMSGLNSTISSIDIDHTQKWHNRLAQVSVKGLKFLNDKSVFDKDQKQGERNHLSPFVANRGPSNSARTGETMKGRGKRRGKIKRVSRGAGAYGSSVMWRPSEGNFSTQTSQKHDRWKGRRVRQVRNVRELRKMGQMNPQFVSQVTQVQVLHQPSLNPLLLSCDRGVGGLSPLFATKLGSNLPGFVRNSCGTKEISPWFHDQREDLSLLVSGGSRR